MCYLRKWPTVCWSSHLLGSPLYRKVFFGKDDPLERNGGPKENRPLLNILKVPTAHPLWNTPNGNIVFHFHIFEGGRTFWRNFVFAENSRAKFFNLPRVFTLVLHFRENNIFAKIFVKYHVIKVFSQKLPHLYMLLTSYNFFGRNFKKFQPA